MVIATPHPSRQAVPPSPTGEGYCKPYLDAPTARKRGIFTNRRGDLWSSVLIFVSIPSSRVVVGADPYRFVENYLLVRSTHGRYSPSNRRGDDVCEANSQRSVAKYLAVHWSSVPMREDAILPYEGWCAKNRTSPSLLLREKGDTKRSEVWMRS